MFKAIFNKAADLFIKENYNMGKYAPQWFYHFFFGNGKDIILENDHYLIKWEETDLTDKLYSFPGVKVGRTGICRARTVSGFYWCVGTYNWEIIEDLGTHWLVQCTDYYDFHRTGHEGSWKFKFPISAKKWMVGLKPIIPFSYWFEPVYKPSYSEIKEVDEEGSKTHFNVCFVETDLNKLGRPFYTKWKIKIEKQTERFWGEEDELCQEYSDE
jgi:hypothetical protein